MSQALRQGVRSAMRAAPPPLRTLPQSRTKADLEREALAHNNRGIELGQRAQLSPGEVELLEAAVIEFDRAIDLCPQGFGPWSNRGNALRELGRIREALASYNRAIELNPGHALAWCGRGEVLLVMNEVRDALESFDRAIALQPALSPAHVGRGVALCQMRQLDAALKCFDTAMALDPKSVAYGHKGSALLLNGRFEGLRILESRPLIFRSRGSNFERPCWSGSEPIAGKTVALFAEVAMVDYGLGDLIQFSRYASLLAARGARVILEAPAPLRRLLASLDGVAQIVAPGDLADRDFWAPLLSLPLAFKTTLETIPASIPYLHAAPERVHYWGERLGPRGKPRVGLVWSGGVKPRAAQWNVLDKNRNMPLAKLAPLKDVDCEFYSLQKGQAAEEELARAVAQGWDGPKLLNFVSELHDFAETAALIENLDLVIAVDTSTAHLAGALGKPVWLLNRFDTCWRWMLDREDSPWYPTMKIYRQATPGDWDGVIARVREDLERLASSAAASSAAATSDSVPGSGTELTE